jgi:hypothetical protein
LLDHDIIVRLHEEQPRVLQRLLLKRAEAEWRRLQADGRAPESITHQDEPTFGHWYVMEGPKGFLDLAACGENIDEPGCDEDDRLNRAPVVCRKCLALLRKVAGEAVYQAQQRARLRFLRRGLA